jgi:hypothetical protein
LMRVLLPFSSLLALCKTEPKTLLIISCVLSRASAKQYPEGVCH